MRDAIKISHGGIKCDKEGCGYINVEWPMSTSQERKISIGLPCPKCGSSLLTRGDYLLVESMTLVIEWFNWLVGPVKEPSVTSPEVKVRIRMNGSGLPVGFEIKDKE